MGIADGEREREKASENNGSECVCIHLPYPNSIRFLWPKSSVNANKLDPHYVEWSKKEENKHGYRRRFSHWNGSNKFSILRKTIFVLNI